MTAAPVVPGMADCDDVMTVSVSHDAVPAQLGLAGLPAGGRTFFGTDIARPPGAFRFFRRLPAVIGSRRRSAVQRVWPARGADVTPLRQNWRSLGKRGCKDRDGRNCQYK